jgi:hypothetical protein
MTIERTVEIQSDRRLVLDLPLELPVGRARVAITVTPERNETPEERRQRSREAIERCRGLGKRLGSKVTSDDVIAGHREDLAREDAKYQRLYGKDSAAK